MQATNFFVRNPIEISLNISRFLYQKDLCSWGLCSKETLAKLDGIWKAIFERDNKGYSPHHVASWRLLVFSQRIQVRNLKRYSFEELVVKGNSSHVIIDREVYTLAEGRLRPTKSESEKLDEILIPQKKASALSRMSRGYFVTRDSQSLTVWKQRSPLLTLDGNDYRHDGQYYLHSDFLLCELPEQDGTNERILWSLVGDIKKIIIRAPTDSKYMGIFDDKICIHQKNLGLAFYSLKDASLCEIRSLPVHFNVDKMIVSKNNIFCVAPSGEIHCFDVASNTIIKKYPFAKEFVFPCLTVSGNRVCVLDENILKIFDRDSQELLFTKEGLRGEPLNLRIHSGILHLKTAQDFRLYNMQNFEYLNSFNPQVESGDGWIYNKQNHRFMNLLTRPVVNSSATEAAAVAASVGRNVWCFFKGFSDCMEAANNARIVSEIARGHSSSFSNAAFLLDSNNHNDDDSGDDSD